jgi:(S)-3,5-dihydroxyphenylglycine transaminase
VSTSAEILRPAALLSLADFARLAVERLDPAVWDFIEGGAGDERTVAANRAAFDQTWLRPAALPGAHLPAPAVTVLGRSWPMPFGVAPLAYHTLVHPDGELATVRAAGGTGVPVVVSTFAGRTFEEIAAAASAPLWLQVYGFRDPRVTAELVRRAAAAGFEALVLTVDTPFLGRRLRDVRNGFRLPAGVFPANLPDADYGSPAGHARAELDPALDWSLIRRLSDLSGLPVLAKGVLSAGDARRALDAGAAGVVVSNHGGRQLDGAPPTLAVLPEVVEAVAGAAPVLLDGGIRRGADVLAAVALGADAVLLGRPILHGLAVAGREGVARVLDIVRDELLDAMALCGLPSRAEVKPGLVATPRSRTLAARTEVVLRRHDLHASVSDPLLDTMNFLNEVAARYPAAISFAPGRPHDKFFETEQIFDNIRRYLAHLADEGRSPEQIRGLMYQYGPTAGMIRELIAGSLRVDEGIDVAPESIVVTVGCQEAMLLVVRALIRNPGDVLLVASPSYVGISGAARLLDAEVVPVVERPDGLDPRDVEAVIEAQRALGRHPRALYLIPDHSNPAGTTIALPARRALLRLAARHDILLLEDSPYRLVSAGERVPALKALDTAKRVVSLGSYAKTIFPGARLGYVVADQTVIGDAGETGLLADELAKIKSMVTVNTSPLSQAAVAGALLAAGGRVADMNAAPARHYSDSMAMVLDRLDARLPHDRRRALGIGWNRPSGGFFMNLTVPFVADNAALTRSAERFGVLWTPMSYFYPGGGGERGIRLSTSYLTAAEIEDGIDRLVRFMECESAA